MLVYGDHALEIDARAQLAELDVHLVQARGHAQLVGAFIDASAIAQGLTDAEAEARGHDARGVLGDRAMQLLVALAHEVAASWRALRVDLAPARAALAHLRTAAMPEIVRAKRAEGYAFYAVYPEAYYEAALRAPTRERHVIGLRSIGTGLAAMVAAATGAPLPSTIRPGGDPFRRTVRVDDALIATTGAVAPGPRRVPEGEVLGEVKGRARGPVISIVDEGPGMSGSSFGAVIDLLEARGVPLERIECFPSHANDLGPEATDAHRARWRRVARYVVDCDELLVRSGRLADAIAALVGPLTEPLRDLSGGGWRALKGDAPAIPQGERRKFLARTRDGAYLAKFVGLGRDGEHARDRASVLAAAGFTPEVYGLVHGFLVERWLDAPLLDPRSLDRHHLTAHVQRYLAFRARRFPASRARGASATQLLEMARRNAGLALGTWTARALDRFSAHALEPRIRRIETDGKLHAWEWLVCADGTLVKTDAVDHHASHDLIGCQDLAWDVAGAAIELGIDVPCDCDPELLAFYRVCYLAFELGRNVLAGGDATAYSEALASELSRSR
jgi:hypothetical protein